MKIDIEFLTLITIKLTCTSLYCVGVHPKRIIKRLNESFSIECFIDYANGTLDFYDGDEIVPENFITVRQQKSLILQKYFVKQTFNIDTIIYILFIFKRVNGTFIKVTRSFSKPAKKNFTCRRNHVNNVGEVDVFVDDDTSPVTDFKCVTRDLKILSCSFKPPVFAAPISYNVNFTVNSNFQKVIRFLLL